MDAKKCDRCGNYYEEKPSKSFAYLIRKKREYSNSSSLFITIDLCDKCRQEFMNWIEAGKASPNIIEKPKSYETYDKNTSLVDAIDIEKLVTLVWPENLTQRARLKNALKNTTLSYIYLEDGPRGIGKETWKKVKEYILTKKEIWR